MRRPVKPFVTEYKGSVRRHAPSTGNTSKRLGEDELNLFSPPSAPDHAPGADHGTRHDPADEDSYEAAMRAADALFAPAPRQADAAESGNDAPARTGRVLRAMDEKPIVPDFSELEAAYAPKKRGRKPGSKNKPKFPVKSLPPTAYREPPQKPVAPVFTASHAGLSAPSTPLAHQAPPPRRPMERPVERRVTKSASEPFSWVRTKLGPGERWKRRLPKVCW